MATFNTAGLGGSTDASPSYTPTLRVEPRVTTVNFGDGYEQRIHKGLNVAPRVWDLAFNNRSDTDRNNIIDFFQNSMRNLGLFFGADDHRTRSGIAHSLSFFRK